MNNKEEHLNSYIENLPNSCANTLVNKDIPCDTPSSLSTPSSPNPVEFETITCPELSQIELNNFCFYNSKCILVCPKNVNLNKNLVPSENNSSIIDTFIGDFKVFNPKKKYIDPNVFTYKGFVDRFNNNVSNVTYKKVIHK